MQSLQKRLKRPISICDYFALPLHNRSKWMVQIKTPFVCLYDRSVNVKEQVFSHIVFCLWSKHEAVEYFTRSQYWHLWAPTFTLWERRSGSQAVIWWYWTAWSTVTPLALPSHMVACKSMLNRENTYIHDLNLRYFSLHDVLKQFHNQIHLIMITRGLSLLVFLQIVIMLKYQK